MKSHVPDCVLNGTTKCAHNFSCIETSKCGDKEMCKVEYANGGQILFLKDRKYSDCPYRLLFGDRQICRCPTHYALHTQEA